MLTSRTIVLCYHRVGAPADDPLELSVEPDRLGAQLGWLGKRVEIVPLSEVLNGSRHPRAAITFDDGYADNVGFGLDILEDAKVPATVFVVAGYVGTDRRFWWDRLVSLLLQQDLPPFLQLEIIGRHLWLDVRSSSARRRSFWALHQRMLWSPRADIESMFALLEAQVRNVLTESEMDGRVVTLSELRRMANHPYCTVGSHTLTHPLLSTLDPSAQLEELSSARHCLEELIERPVTQFAYPFGGVGAFNGRTVAAVKRSGHELACATTAGTVHPRLDRFRVPRFLVRNWDLGTFQTRVDRWLNGMP